MAVETVPVAVTDRLDMRCLDRIREVSPRVRLDDLSALVAEERSGRRVDPRSLDTLLERCEVVCGHIMPDDLIRRAPRLKWIHSTWTGVDTFLTPEIAASPVTVTNTTGIHEVPMAESVLGFMLMFVKSAADCFEQKRSRRWRQYVPGTLAGQTVGIVGLGGVGREVARLAKAFGMTVRAVRRSASGAAPADHVDELLPPERLDHLLEISDFVVLALPGTPATRRLIGETQLRAMKPTARLINISRGDIVDETALELALEEGRIAGAALDVFRNEPLPADSRLWELPTVIFSPHVTGEIEDYDRRATEGFCTNLKRFVAGEPLQNIVDKQAGY